MPDTTEQKTSVTLRYIGPDVENGTMSVTELMEALQGFSGAYSKVGAFLNAPDVQLRVSAPQRGSFSIDFVAFAALLAQHQTQFQNIGHVWDWAKRIFGVIKEIMNLKKQTKGLPFKIEISGDNNLVQVITAENVVVPISREAHEVSEKKIIDADVQKIVEPLRSKRIETAELALDNKVEVAVTAEERKYFQPGVLVFTEKPDEAVGTLLSLSKQTNKGTFEMQDGAHVSYHYVGDDKYSFYTDFSYRGVVRVFGTIQYDSNNKPTHIEINRVERLQADLNFPES